MKKMNGGVNYIGKSTEQKPDQNVKPGEIIYLVDTKQIFIFYDGQWWEMNE